MVNQLCTLMNKLETNETTFIKNFNIDTSLGIKFFYQVDRCLQQFILSWSNVSYVEDVDFDIISFSHIHLSFIRQQRLCTLPISFSGNKRPKDHIQHGTNTKSKEGDHGVIKNESQISLVNWKTTSPKGRLHGNYFARLTDVWQDQTLLQKFGIKMIPPQRLK